MDIVVAQQQITARELMKETSQNRNETMRKREKLHVLLFQIKLFKLNAPSPYPLAHRAKRGARVLILTCVECCYTRRD